MKVERLIEGGWLVTGTDDETVAMNAILDSYEYWDCMGPLEDAGADQIPHPDVVYAGLCRKVPCSPRSCGEHGWHLRTHVIKPGRGVFSGVFIEGIQWELEQEGN